MKMSQDGRPEDPVWAAEAVRYLDEVVDTPKLHVVEKGTGCMTQVGSAGLDGASGAKPTPPFRVFGGRERVEKPR